MAKVQIQSVHFIEDSDDEVFLAEMLFETEQVQLEVIHHPSLESFLGWERRTKVKFTDPMLVLVDMNMPGQRGNEVIKKILADPRFSKAIVGMCSGSEDPADKRDAVNAGAQFFVQKPLNAACIRNIAAAVKKLSVKGNDQLVLEYETG